MLDAPADDVARWVRNQGLVEALGPHRCRLVIGSWSWQSLAAWIGLFDADIEVVGPPKLRAATVRLAERYAAAAGAPA